MAHFVLVVLFFFFFCFDSAAKIVLCRDLCGELCWAAVELSVLLAHSGAAAEPGSCCLHSPAGLGVPFGLSKPPIQCPRAGKAGGVCCKSGLGDLKPPEGDWQVQLQCQWIFSSLEVFPLLLELTESVLRVFLFNTAVLEGGFHCPCQHSVFWCLHPALPGLPEP